ncbi:helix-turn-helix transcriptional regulator [Candidatus Albibeggiatoa sp. nov. BB20]|uniref:helix-turn-helix domain-containing protein n=1 Tax=Candidatus Albibeggiatoa sp. nov. BB20 TaxID=3162723 RepID=UPI003365A6EC
MTNLFTISPPADKPNFAQLLTRYMQQMEVSVTQLAKDLNLRRETLARWSNGKVLHPRLSKDVLRCAVYLGLNTQQRDELLIAAGFAPVGMSTSMHSTDLPISLTALHWSPFIIGPPITEPSQFFGRDYVVKRIFDVWRCMPLQHIAVVGLKRSGKTSLLHYLRRVIETPQEQLRDKQRNDWLSPGYQWVFVDFQDPRMCYQESLLRHILVELDLPVPEPCDLVGFMEIIDSYLEIPTLVLLDEIGAGLEAPELDEQFWWGLRSLGSNHAGGKIGFLMTAHQAPEELMIDHHRPSPFFNIFGHVFFLDELEENEALDLILSSPIPFPEQDVAWILEQSGRWPALLQIFCHSRLTALEENNQTDRWKKEALRRLQPYKYLLEQQ